jgi:hypothetical protein
MARAHLELRDGGRADGKIKELIDDQIRKRHEELCRTEDRYIEVSEALRNSNLVVRDGMVFHVDGASERSIESLLEVAVSD